mgnify:CR=1 FL=1
MIAAQIFKDKVDLFRDKCYQLTGYKIQLVDNQCANARSTCALILHGRFRLKNAFMERDNDILLFQVTDKGDLQVTRSAHRFAHTVALQLLETDFVKRMPKSVLDYLHRLNSIPAFLAQVTQTLFENQTHILNSRSR